MYSTYLHSLGHGPKHRRSTWPRNTFPLGRPSGSVGTRVMAPRPVAREAPRLPKKMVSHSSPCVDGCCSAFLFYLHLHARVFLLYTDVSLPCDGVPHIRTTLSSTPSHRDLLPTPCGLLTAGAMPCPTARASTAATAAMAWAWGWIVGSCGAKAGFVLRGDRSGSYHLSPCNQTQLHAVAESSVSYLAVSLMHSSLSC